MCPDCKEPLVGFELEGIEIDRCISCGGTWLDAGEMQLIAERSGVEAGRFSDALETARKGSRSKRKCPRCNKRLYELALSENNQTVELDRCPRGDGLWLDRGEMVATIRLFQIHHDDEESAIAQFFGELYKSEISKANKEGD